MKRFISKITILLTVVMIWGQMPLEKVEAATFQYGTTPGVEYRTSAICGPKYPLTIYSGALQKDNEESGGGYYSLDQIIITPKDPSETIFYRVKMEKQGWSEWKKNGQVAGERYVPIYDIQILSNKNDVVYQTYSRSGSGANGSWSKPLITKSGGNYPMRQNDKPISAIKIKVEPRRKALCILGGNVPQKDLDVMEGAFLRNRILTSAVSQPRSASVEDTVAKAFSGSTDKSVNYIYISAHGQNPSGNNYEDFYFTLNSRESMSFRKLVSILDKVKGRKVILIDVCYAGQVVNMFQNRPDLLGDNYRNYQIIASAQKDTVSWMSDMSMSTYSWALAMGFDPKKQEQCSYGSDYNGDGIIMMDEFYNYSETKTTGQSSSCFDINDKNPEHALFFDYEIH